MKGKKVLFFASAVLFTLLLAGCNSSANKGKSVTGGGMGGVFSDSNDIQPLIDKKSAGINKECKKMLFSLSGNRDENYMYSPASITIALTLLEKAASNNTYSQIHSFVGDEKYDLSSDAVEVYNFFVSNESNPLVAKMKSSYKQSISEDPILYADAMELTSGNKKTLASEINEKVSQVTNGQIPSAVEDSMFDDPAFTSLLSNVIHFKGTWADTDEYSIEEDYDFTKTDGSVVHVDALSMSDTGSMRYYEGTGFRAFSVDYKEDDERYRFYGFLPDKEGSIDLENLDFDNFKEPHGKYYIYVMIPKFEFSSSMSLNSALYNAGLRDMFDESDADFSNGFSIKPGSNVYVSDVCQKTKIRFDELGSEASAYTGLYMTTTVSIDEDPTPVYYLDFNHPFLFMILDTKENVPLFIGQVYDPEMDE